MRAPQVPGQLLSRALSTRAICVSRALSTGTIRVPRTLSTWASRVALVVRALSTRANRVAHACNLRETSAVVACLGAFLGCAAGVHATCTFLFCFHHTLSTWWDRALTARGNKQKQPVRLRGVSKPAHICSHSDQCDKATSVGAALGLLFRFGACRGASRRAGTRHRPSHPRVGRRLGIVQTIDARCAVRLV